MKAKILYILTSGTLLLFPIMNFAQAPNLGTVGSFVLFSSAGAVTNTGISHITGNVGTNSGSSTGFGNVNGQMHDGDGVSASASADLLTAYNLLNGTTPMFFPAPLLGNGDTLNEGVYSISAAASLNLDLYLDGQGNANAVFIFQIQGAFSSGPSSRILLLNGAQACNVYWKVEGLVSLAAGTKMKGTIIAHNAAIEIFSGSRLNGRALSIAGAVTVHGVKAFTPVGCGSPVLTGPDAPALASTACYALFSADGAVSNSGITHVVGDIGTNVGLTTGFDPLLVTGTIHPIPDISTATCAADLLNVYNYLNLLPYDINLLYPAQFGNNLNLTPHTYLLDAATVLTDSLYLDAQGNPDAVFVIKINGALSTSTYSKVILTNGAMARNVFWKIEGAVSINNYSVFCGTIICNNGALGLNTGVILDGRALTTTGALTTVAITVNSTNPVVPANLYLTNIIVADTRVYNAMQTITVAGNGTYFIVQPGGNVSMIAGQEIHYMPGTTVLSGGYLHGYISESPCGMQPLSMLTTTVNENKPIIGDKSNLFRVYPNPTEGKFTLELLASEQLSRPVVQIYSMLGAKVIEEDMTGNKSKEFSINNMQPGIYFIHVTMGDRSSNAKIIKKY